MALRNPPLTEQHLPIIQQAIADAEEAQRHVDMAKQAGFDVGNRADQIDKTKQQLLKIKNTYFPGH